MVQTPLSEWNSCFSDNPLAAAAYANVIGYIQLEWVSVRVEVGEFLSFQRRNFEMSHLSIFTQMYSLY